MYERTYHKAVLKAEQKQPKKGQTRINWKRVLWIIGTLVALTAIVFLIRLPRVQVKNIEVNGTNVAYPGDVSEFVQNQLRGNKLFILPKTSIFLIPTHTLEKDIAAAFPRFQTVTINRKNFSTISVNVTEYQGVYLWCVDSDTCYFMDQNGMAFAPAPYFSGDAYPKIFNGTLQQIPFQAVTAGQLAIIATLMSHVPSLGIEPSEFHFDSAHQLRMTFIHNGQQSMLLFDPTSSINDAITALFTGLRTDPLASKFRDANRVLQYIDLRFSDRVVYKFQ